MKRLLFIVVLFARLAAQATLYTQTFSGGAIADGNPSGAVFSGSFDQAPSGYTVSQLTISLNISGGYNGDLYGYLVAPDGTMVVLMNQPGVAINGFGASGAGMNITLSDGFSSIQNVTTGGTLSGTYGATGSLAGFNGSPVDGTWELYFADLSTGGGTSVLDNWTLNITAVPEPVNTVLAAFGALFVLIRIFCSKIKQRGTTG